MDDKELEALVMKWQSEGQPDDVIAEAIRQWDSSKVAAPPAEPEGKSLGGFAKNFGNDLLDMGHSALKLVNPIDALTGPGSGPIDTLVESAKRGQAEQEAMKTQLGGRRTTAADIAQEHKAGGGFTGVMQRTGDQLYEHPGEAAAALLPAMAPVVPRVVAGAGAAYPAIRAVASHPATGAVLGGAAGYARGGLGGLVEGAIEGSIPGAMGKVVKALNKPAEEAAAATHAAPKPRLGPPAADFEAAMRAELEKRLGGVEFPSDAPNLGMPHNNTEAGIGQVSPREVINAKRPFGSEPIPEGGVLRDATPPLVDDIGEAVASQAGKAPDLTYRVRKSVDPPEYSTGKVSADDVTKAKQPFQSKPNTDAAAPPAPLVDTFRQQLLDSLKARMPKSKSKGAGGGMSANDIASVDDVLAQDNVLEMLAKELKTRRASRHQTNYSNAKDAAAMRNAK